MPSPEPRFARIAAAIADPTRARMLAVLLGGEHRSAGELARAADITPQAASAQLAHLLDAQLIHVRTQGRHRMFALADAEIAHALEALALIAERDAVNTRWESPRYAPLKCARKCYGHLAGELGVSLYQSLRAKALIANDAQGDLQLTPAGAQRLTAMKIDVAALQKAKARLAYPCMDWSERQDHLAGTLARRLLEHFLEKRWLVETRGSRALALSDVGRVELARLFEA